MLVRVFAAGISNCLQMGRMVRVRRDSLCAGEPKMGSQQFLCTPYGSLAESIGLRILWTARHMLEIPSSGEIMEGLAGILVAII